MASWRVNGVYGHGVGNIPLKGDVHRRPSRPDNLRQGLSRLALEFREGDQTIRWLIHVLPLVVFTMFIAVSVTISINTPPVDYSPVEIVLLDPLPPPIEEPLPEIEEPIPEVVPEPPPAKVAKREPPPKPEPVVERTKPPKIEIARIEPPKPPPITETPKPRETVRTRPEPVRPDRTPPKVRIDQVAQAPEPTRPLPTQRRLIEHKTAKARPKPELDTVAALSAPQPTPPTPTSRTRHEAPRQTRNAPRTLAAMPDLARPAQPPEPAPPPRPQRFAMAKTRKTTASPRIEAAPMLPVNDAEPTAAAPQRTRQPQRVAATSRPKTAPPNLVAPSAAPSLPKATASPPPSRTASVASTRRASSRSSDVDKSTLAMPARAAREPVPAAIDSSASHRSRPIVSAPSQSPQRTDSSIHGVSLASLDACLTDRREDSLKRKLVAAVTTQQECVSAAGTYRFVETKNLNAFLMRIERNPSRPKGDRCAELQHAIDCLAQ